MSTKERTIKKKKVSDSTESNENKFLVLHNDDINTFDHVIDKLIEICGHDAIQAEQCAYITHFKGKCDVKKGVLNVLKPLKDKLISSGLSVTID